MWLLFLLAGVVVALIVRWWIRSKNNSSPDETSVQQHTMIDGGHYLRGLPGVDRSYYFIKFLPTTEGFDLYSTVEGKFEKFATLLKSEIDSITIADKSFSVKKFNTEMMPLLGVAGAVAFKKNKNYDVAIMTVIVIKDALSHEGVFSFEQQDSRDESAALANKTMEQLISHLKSIEN